MAYERAYDHGCDCSGGCCPSDAALRLADRLTPAAAEMVTLHGVLEPFAEAAGKTLPRSADLNVSAATVRRVTERVGGDLARRRAAGETFGTPAGEDAGGWDWCRDAAGDRCGYVQLDATGVRQQGARGGAADGRMVWVGGVFNFPQAGAEEPVRTRQARYSAGLAVADGAGANGAGAGRTGLREVARQLGADARAVGLADADVLIGLTDGGAGIEDGLLEEVFAGLGKPVEFIPDFYHAAEHVHAFADLLHAGDGPAARERAATWCRRLKHEGGAALWRALTGLDVTDRSEAVGEAHRRLCGYLHRNLHRTDYPRYAARGWHVGSGAIESACKNLINRRLNGCGMRWRERGTNELAHLRALFKSPRAARADYWSRPHATQAA